MLEPQDTYEVVKRSRDLLLLTILGLVALLFSGQHTTTAFSKTTSFFVLVWLTLILELILAWKGDQPNLWLWWPTLVCLGAFLLWSSVSAIWIAPIPRSFRELSRWIALTSLIVVAIGAGRSAWFRRQVLWFGTIVPMVIAVYACLQSLGYDFFVWPEFTWGGDFRRVTSTLGNPDFLAGYLVGTLPLTVAFGLASSTRWQKGLAGVSVSLQFIAILLSLSRGVWIGVFCALAGLLLILPDWRRFFIHLWNFVKRPKKTVVILVVVLVALIILWPALSNLYLRITEGSPTGRWLIYVSSWQLVLKHPILGVGLDAFPIRFPEVRNPKLSQYLPIGEWYVEHTHSEPLEVLVDLGIIGFLFWGGLLFFWGRTILKGLENLDRRQALLVGASWVGALGILGHNLVTVTLRHGSAAVLFWALFGIAMGAFGGENTVQSRRTLNVWRWIVLVLIVVGAPLVWLHGIREHQADRYLREANNVIERTLSASPKHRDRMVEQCHVVLDLLAKADRLAPVRKESLYWRAWAYYELGDYAAARDEYKRTIDLEGPFVDSVPNIGKSLLRLGAVYLAAGFRHRALETYRESLHWWKWACALDPQNANHWRDRAGALGMVGKIAQARAAFSRALERETDPDRKEKIRFLMQRLDQDADALQKQANRAYK